MLKYLNPNYVVVQLQHGRVPAGVQATLLTIVALMQVLVGRPGLVGPLSNPSLHVFVVLELLFVIIAVWVGYHANGGPSGHDFILRYLTLSCVLYIWVYAAALVVYYLVHIALYYSPWLDAERVFRPYGPAQLAFYLATASAFIYVLQRFLRRVAAVDAP